MLILLRYSLVHVDLGISCIKMCISYCEDFWDRGFRSQSDNFIFQSVNPKM